MSVVQEKIAKIVYDQPEDSSYEEIIKEIIFDHMIERGIEDSKNGKTITTDELKDRMKSWAK